MSRARMVKPAVFKHEALFDLEQRTGLPIRFAWVGLWTVADREGRFKWRPRELKTDVLPFDDLEFGRVLDALAEIGCVVKYVVDGKAFGWIPTWHEHQKPHVREAPSELPPPPSDSHNLGSAVRNLSREGIGDGDGDGKVAAATVPAKQRKPVTEHAGLVGDLAREWAKAHATPEVEKPVPEWSDEAATVIGRAKTHGEDEVKRRWSNYLKCQDPFYAGHPLLLFVKGSTFDRFMHMCRRACCPARVDDLPVYAPPDSGPCEGCGRPHAEHGTRGSLLLCLEGGGFYRPREAATTGGSRG